MGVPGFFLWLVRRYKNKLVLKNIDNPVNELLIDANCMIHPECFKVLNDNPTWKNLNELENKMLDQITNYLDFIIEFSKPTDLIYISIDGVAPIAKIKQQRSRRFKSYADSLEINKIKKRHNKTINNHWTNASITPGTQFMYKITKKIQSHINESLVKWKEIAGNQNLKVIFSSANSPGEGEHKILQYIKNKRFKKDTTLTIYGLDADLIFLSLASQVKNIFLLREATQLNQGTAGVNTGVVFNWVPINSLRFVIVELFKRSISKEYALSNIQQIVRDFVFICYLLGNDFLPHLPSLDIYNDGLDNLIDVYSNCALESESFGIVKVENKNATIDYDSLLQVLESLAVAEPEILQRDFLNKKTFDNTSYEDTSYEREFMNYERLQYHIDDPVKIGSDDSYKERYYKYYFGENYSIDDICQNYFDGLVWIGKYYFTECASWNWYYKYDHAPFVSDLFDYLANKKLKECTFVKGEPLQPIMQLLCVLPPQYSFLVPKLYSKLMTSDKSPIKIMYPMEFKQDYINKRKYWQAIPILPPVDLPNVNKQANKLNEHVLKNPTKYKKESWFLKNINCTKNYKVYK